MIVSTHPTDPLAHPALPAPTHLSFEGGPPEFLDIIKIYGPVLGAAQLATDLELVSRRSALSFFNDPQDGWAHSYDVNEFLYALSHIEITGQAPTRWHQKILLRNDLVEKRSFKTGPYESRIILMLTPRGRSAMVFGTVVMFERRLSSDQVADLMFVSRDEFSDDMMQDFLFANETLAKRLPVAWSNDFDLTLMLAQFNNWDDEAP